MLKSKQRKKISIIIFAFILIGTTISGYSLINAIGKENQSQIKPISITNGSNNEFFIIKINDKCLTAPESNIPLSTVSLQQCSNSQYQLFTKYQLSNGAISIKSFTNSQCLDVRISGSIIRQYPCINSSGRQEFKYINNKLCLTENNTLCLDNNGRFSKKGVNLEIIKTNDSNKKDTAIVYNTDQLYQVVNSSNNYQRILIMPGYYSINKSIVLTKNSDKKLIIEGLDSSKTILDASSFSDNVHNSIISSVNSKNIVIRNLTINANKIIDIHGVYCKSCSNNIYDNINFYNNKGIALIGDNTEGNLIENIDAYNACSSSVNGEDGTGISIVLGSGKDNTIFGGRVGNTCDNGIQLFAFKTPVNLIGSFAYNAGINLLHLNNFQGDGVGFKLGGDGAPVNHNIQYDLSIGNKLLGFTNNSNNGYFDLNHLVSINDNSPFFFEGAQYTTSKLYQANYSQLYDKNIQNYVHTINKKNSLIKNDFVSKIENSKRDINGSFSFNPFQIINNLIISKN